MNQINPQQLKKFLEATTNPPVILDVREPWEFQTCHIDGSVHVPMGQIPNVYTKFDPNKQVVVICHHGMRSLQVAQFLERAGFQNVVNLVGGIDAWAREVDPNMPTY